MPDSLRTLIADTAPEDDPLSIFLEDTEAAYDDQENHDG